MSDKRCQKCNSNKVASVSAKCSDLCHWKLGNAERNGYVPRGMGITNPERDWGDYVEFDYCLDCGQIQGEFPVVRTMTKAQLKHFRKERPKYA